MLKKMPKNKPDVKFINTETMEVECTYNQCFQKFVESEEYVIKTPDWHDYEPIKHKNYFHKCKECDRRYASSEDKTKSVRSYESFPDEKLTPEDIKTVLKKLKKIYEATTDPFKQKQIAKVVNKYNGKQNG